MFLSKKVHLILTQEQYQLFQQTMFMTCCVYNEAMEMTKEYYKEKNYLPDVLTIIRKFRRESKTNKFANKFSDYLVNRAIKDAVEVYSRNVNTNTYVPAYKSLKYTPYSFSLGRPKTIIVKKKGIFIGGICTKEENSTLNYLRLSEYGSVPKYVKICAMTISFDGISFYFNFSFETGTRDLFKAKTDGVGIDVGIKTLATLSDGRVYENILHTKKMQDLLWRQKEMQSNISKLRSKLTNKDGELERSSELQKLELKFKKLNMKIKNIRKDYLHKVSSDIIAKNPQFIGIESLNIRSMMSDEHSLADRLQKTALKMFLEMIEYKATLYNIPLIKVDQKFPSSKKCCNCGHIKEDLTLSDRTYVCNICGFQIDRDKNAAVNIYKCALCIYRTKREGIHIPLDSYYSKEYKSWKNKIANDINNC